jgi:hypothetical protein
MTTGRINQITTFAGGSPAMVKVYSQNSKTLLTLYESLSPKVEYDSSHMVYYLHQLEHFL